jgi:hypothetical protein
LEVSAEVPVVTRVETEEVVVAEIHEAEVDNIQLDGATMIFHTWMGKLYLMIPLLI